MSNKAAIFVTSFLLVTLIYGQITNFEVSARPPKHIDNLCRDATPTAPGAVTAQVCCQIINGVITVCNKCQYDANGNTVESGCINFYPERQMPGGNSTLPPISAGTSLSSSDNNTGLTNGQTGPPNHLGTVLPSSGNNTNTGTSPTSTITKEHNTSSPKLLSSTGNPTNPSNNNQQTSGHHHHNGSSISSSSGSGSSSGASSSKGSSSSSSSGSGSNTGSGSNHH